MSLTNGTINGTTERAQRMGLADAKPATEPKANAKPKAEPKARGRASKADAASGATAFMRLAQKAARPAVNVANPGAALRAVLADYAERAAALRDALALIEAGGSPKGYRPIPGVSPALDLCTSLGLTRMDRAAALERLASITLD